MCAAQYAVQLRMFQTRDFFWGGGLATEINNHHHTFSILANNQLMKWLTGSQLNTNDTKFNMNSSFGSLPEGIS